MSSPYQPNKTLWLNYWRGIYATPRAWAMKGENLIHAFEAVAAASVEGSMQFDMKDQALMLAGMGIEVMLKALLVENAHTRDLVSRVRQPTTVVETDLQKTFYRHNLVALAFAARLSLSKQQTEVAEALSTYIYWRGRYVMPTERGIDDIIPIKHENGLVGPPHRHVTYEEARELIDQVIAEVHRRLYNKA
jgi:hypothetical protein